MKLLLTITNGKAFFVAIICLVMGFATSAHAVPEKQLLRRFDTQVFTGGCCFLWNESVSVTEPKTVVPVVVTWSTDYKIDFQKSVAAGLSVNGSACQNLGGGRFEHSRVESGQFDTATLQFVIRPSEGLHTGTNTFTLCGGGLFGGESLTIGPNTLQVRLSK